MAGTEPEGDGLETMSPERTMEVFQEILDLDSEVVTAISAFAVSVVGFPPGLARPVSAAIAVDIRDYCRSKLAQRN